MAKRDADLRTSKLKLAGAVLALNALIIATFLTSTPTVSPASTWIVAANRVLYSANLKRSGSLAELHAKASTLSKEDCIACHGTMKGHKLALHRIHLTSDLIPGLSCTNCHDRIAVQPKSNTKVVHVVNVAFCKKCHSPFPASSDPNSAMKPEDSQADCRTCHSGRHALRHAQPYLSQIVGSRECLVCHGGSILPWTAKHEQADWISEHGKSALGNVPRCMKCHEYGLAFCTECHRNKPPSHQPRPRWLEVHKNAARRDTRACFTCHKTSYCKRCHINHATGWLKTHPEFVVSGGAQPCLKCHSASFCDGCHLSPRAPKKARAR